MAINQTIVVPLTLHSGSLTSHTVPSANVQGQLMTLVSSSIPDFDPAFWEYKIKTETTYITSSVQTGIPELYVNLTDTTKYHLILGFYSLGCSSVTSIAKLGFTATSLSFPSDAFNIVTETPTSLTATVATYEATPSSAVNTWPSANVNNFYLARHIGVAKPSTTSGQFRPDLAVSASGALLTASMGPSIILWRKF